MKSKLFKKAIAGICTAAMVMQFGFVIPANAAEIYSQDFESVTAIGSAGWTAQDTSALVLGTGDATYGNYLSYDFSSISTNSRGLETSFTANVADKEYYVVEFDAALSAGNGQTTELAVKTSKFGYYSNNVNYGAEKGYLFKMSASAGGTSWTINENNDVQATISAGTWHHYKLIVNTKLKLTSVTISNGSSTVLDKAVVGVNGDAADITGIYALAGRYYPVLKFDNIVVRDKEDTDDFGELPEEKIQKAVFSKALGSVITQPAEGKNVDYPIELNVTGTLGSDLTSDVKVIWSVKGIEDEDGYITFTGEENSTTANLNVRNGVSNWFGYVQADVSYNDGEVVTVKTPFAVIGASAGAANQLAPVAGYPVDMNTYSDNIVGYVGTASGITDKDIILNNWSIYGSNSARTMKLVQDEAGTKSIEFASNGGSGSTVAVYQWVDQTSQYIVKMRVKSADGMGFGVYFNTPNNGDSNPEWAASYSGGAILSGTASIPNVPAGEWVDVVVSADPSIQKYIIAAYKTDGTLIGQTEELDMANNDKVQKYFCFQGGYPIYLQSFEAYKPVLSTMTVNAAADVVKIPEADPVDVGEKAVISYDSSTVTVVSPDAYTNAKVIGVSYKEDGLLDSVNLRSMSLTPHTVTEGAYIGTVSMPGLAADSEIMFWDGFENVVPLADIYTVTGEEEIVESKTTTLDLSATLLTSDGTKITGPVTWELEDEYQGVGIESTGTQTAKLTVSSTAGAGDIVVNAKYGSTVQSKTLTMLASADSVVFTKSNSSITIPFSGEAAVVSEFAAETRDKNGNVKDGTITYKFFDKTGAAELAQLPAGITFEDGKLTVTDTAKPAVIYVAAVNETGLTSKVKVNIHGLSFAFGSDEVAEGYTQVTAESQYTEKAGYGFADISSLTANATNVTGKDAYQFKANVPNGNYVVSVETTSAAITSEVVDGISATTGISKSGNSFNVAVCDGVLDLTFAAASNITSLTISQAAAKQALAKPNVYAIGDSTTKNNANGGKSWGNCVEDGGVIVPDAFTSFANHGMAGRDSVSYYNQARVEAVLLAVCPGDYVTVNMGINSKETGEGSSYETLVSKYYIDGIIQRGAIPVIVTATPQGPVGNYTSNYKDGVFTCNRGDGARNNVLRALAKEKGLNIIELSLWGDEYFNSLTVEDAEAAGFSTVLELVQSWYVDHNHYAEPLAKKIGEYILDCLAEIAGGSEDYKADAE